MLSPNETLHGFALPNIIINLEIYNEKHGFCPFKVLVQAGFALPQHNHQPRDLQ